MSDTSIVDNATNPVADSTPVAPAATGSTSGTPESTPASVDTTVPGDQPAPDPEPKRDRKVEKRISRLTQQREAAIREAGYWRGIAEAGTPRQTEQQADGERPQQQERTRQEATYTQDDAHKAQAAMERIMEAGEDSDDLDELVETLKSPKLPITAPMVDVLLATEKPAEMARWMTENAKELARIAMLPRELAYRALEKVEARLATKPAPKITNAPPPPPTVNGRGTPSFDPEKASMDDYAKHWEQRRAKAGIRG
jgi:hypothetical protein